MEQSTLTKRKLSEAEEIEQYKEKRLKREEDKNKNTASFLDEKRKRTLLAKQDDMNIVENEREKARRNYLTKRVDDKMTDLELRIRDEKNCFKSEELSKRERLKADNDKLFLSVLKVQQKRSKQTEQYYEIPSEDKMEINYTDEKKKDKSKQRGLNEWESRQLKTGYYKKRKATDEEEFEMLNDEFIDFEAGGIEGDLEMMKNRNDNEKKDEEERVKRESDMCIEEVRKSLPIFEYKDEFLRVVKENQVIVVEGETGSGKTTQMPQYLLDAGWAENGMKIGCTQPRRVAAMSVAARVAQEMKVKLGDRVGYSVRFESRVSEATQVKYMTDGMLLREFLTDPHMNGYSVLIIDEAHERTIQTDLIFGLLKIILQERDDLRVIVSSATCDTKKFSEFFDDAPVFKIHGRRYEVDILYTKEQEPDYVDAAVMTVFQIHITQPADGDILVFLTGQEEIEEAMDDIQDRIRALGSKIRELLVLPVYSALPSEKQARIFLPTPPGARKVVLATNIAETSLTIDNIRYVIDCGYCKQKSHNAKARIDTLRVVPVSQASAIQRAGRAGRVGPGKCFRLYKKCTFDEELDQQPVPEIQRTCLSGVVLLLLSLGVSIQQLDQFQLLDMPDKRARDQAVRQLYGLGALTTAVTGGGLSHCGLKMVELPCDPCLAAMLVRAPEFGCGEQALTLAAMLCVVEGGGGGSVFYRPRGPKRIYADQAHRAFLHEDGDPLTLLQVYEQYALAEYSGDWCREHYVQARSMKQARNIRDQLQGLCDRVELDLQSSTEDTVAIRKAIVAGYFMNTAKFQGDCYRRLKKKDSVYMHSSSVFKLIEDGPPPRYVIYISVLETEKEYMRSVISIDPKWLVEVAPHMYSEKDFQETGKRR